MHELPNNPLSALTLMPSTAAEVARFSKGIIEAVKEGRANPIKVLVMLKSLKAIEELVTEYIKDEVLNEADKYAEKDIDLYGAKVEKYDAGKYNYGVSGDSEWERLDVEEKKIKALKSERETFLKSLKEPIDLLNKETGEIETIRPPFKKSNPSVRVYLKSR